MKRCTGYALEEIGGRFFLFPFGQRGAEFCRDMEINEVGAFIWNYLKDEHELEEIVDACMSEYECAPKDYKDVKFSVEQFVDAMKNRKMVFGKNDYHPVTTDVIKEYTVAGVDIRVKSSEDIAFPMLDKFVKVTEDSGKRISIFLEKRDRKKVAGEVEDVLGDARFILSNEDVKVYYTDFGYRIFFDCYECVSDLFVSFDGDCCSIGYTGNCDKSLSEELFQALRVPFLLYTQRNGMITVHSASIIYKEKGWLFSGKTGCGKTTHTNLWNRYLGTKIFNGDMNLLSCEDGLIYMYGIPWCGTSGVNETGKYPVGGIMFLKQDAVSKIEDLQYSEKVLKLLRRSFSPFWNEEQTNYNTQVCKKVAEATNICELRCTKEKDALEVSREYIDSVAQ